MWSLRAGEEGWETAAVQIDVNVQENLVNLTPRTALEPDTTYVVELPAGGIADTSGNALEDAVELRFSTGETVWRE